MGGPAERPGGGTERGTERETERSVPGMWWYHRSLSPTGPQPKNACNPFSESNRSVLIEMEQGHSHSDDEWEKA